MARVLAPGDRDENGDLVLAPGDPGVKAPGDLSEGERVKAPGDLDTGVRVQGPGDLIPEEEE